MPDPVPGAVPAGSRALLRSVPRRALLGLGALSALRALALVVLAEGVATGVAILAAGGRDGLTAAAATAAVAAVVRALAGWAAQLATARAAARVKLEQRRMLVSAVVEGRAAGSATATLATTGLDALDEFWLATVPAAVGAATVPVVVGLRILAADWVSALLVALTLPLVPLFMVLIGQHSRERTARAQAALVRLADYLVDLAAGLPVLVGLGRADEQRRALAELQRRYSDRIRGTLRTALLSALALELIATISVALVAVVLGLRLLGGGIDLRAALLVLILAPECFAALREVGAAFHSSQRGLEVLGRVRALIGASAPARPAVGTQLTLRLRELRYAERDAAPVGPLALRVRVGESVALVGPSGSGKSSVLAVLTGTLPVDARMRGAASAPARLAVARQDPRFSSGSVRTELALHGPADAGVALAARLGLASVLDADPASLSLGERRRLAVARALLRVDAGATALLLDEPTAHLDPASTAVVLAELDARRAQCAMLVLSHDPELAAWADRVQRMPTRAPTQRIPAPADSGPIAALGPAPAPAPAPTPTSAPGRARAPRAGWPRALAALALAALAAGAAAALTGVSGWLIVRAAQEPAIMYLSVAIVGVRFFGIARAGLRYVERLLVHDAVLRATDRLRLRLWTGIAARGPGSRRLLEGGEATDVLVVQLERIRELWPRVVPPAVAGLAVAAATAVTVGILVPALLPAAVGLLSAGTLGSAALAWVAVRGAARQTESARSELARELGALTAAAVELRLNGVADRAAAGARAAVERSRATEAMAAVGGGLGAAVAVLAGSLLAAFAPLLGAGSRPELVAVVALLGLAAVEPLTGIAGAAQRLPSLRHARARIRPLLDTPPERLGGVLAGRVERVDLVEVALRWPDAAADAVAGVSCTLQRSAWTVLDGPSGAGKSTLLSGLLGALAPRAGRIEYGGRPGALLAPSAIRAHVAWCPQDAHVFDSTLRGNLLIARPREDPPLEAEQLAALRAVGLAHLASGPVELDRRIGRDGERLSGGERQRLAVARALLSRAEVLLLDEPTAHLDSATAEAMMADVRAAAADRVVVLVSHRLADRRAGDRILRLGAGSDAAVGGVPNPLRRRSRKAS